MEEDFQSYLRAKKKIVCTHRPTNLLQKEGPFRPIADALFLYFRSEEGLRALLWKFSNLEDEDNDQDFEDARVKAKLEESYGRMKVDLVPVLQPVTVQFRDVPGARRAKLELHAHETTSEDAYRPVIVTLKEGRGKKLVRVKLQVDEAAVKAHKDRFLRVQLEESGTNAVKLDLVAENQFHELNDLPLPEVYHQSKEKPSPVKVEINDSETGVKVDLSSEDILMADLYPKKKKVKLQDPKEIQQKPVKVGMRTYGSSVEVELVPEDALMSDIKTVKGGPFPPLKVFIAENAAGKGATVQMHPVDVNTIEEEPKRTYRPTRFGNESWVPRENQSLQYPKRKSVLWAEEEMDITDRLSSTKAGWYPNKHYLEGREAAKSPIRTASMSLIKQLRPTVDRPQFSIVPDIINFKKMRFGATGTKAVTVYNYHSDFCRFKVVSKDECIKAVYDHGPLAAGMSRRLKICFKASRAGEFNGKVHIETEFDIFVLPVLSNVLLV